ncbi:tetratricopeptide repeat protein [Azospirillum soli]|uniref:tetratricopeptide repeat protein n=1 Tax=Azospirillum soli TaxID=1304799 RepID=UPI001AE5AF4E|nr:tetratricopeptide repeat protein [Azospirillum soli]MBP2316832.1 putative O-linked N-acetylglucosamine transferase (SPINDLY family) [Azospirillum soli]
MMHTNDTGLAGILDSIRRDIQGHLRNLRLAEAGRSCAILTVLAPATADGAMMQALVHQLGGDWERAERRFVRALVLRPDYAEARANRAALWLLCGQPGQALSDGAVALALAPALPGAHTLRARLLYQQGSHEAAATAARRALALGQDRPELPVILADSLRRQGRLDDAEAACRGFVERIPERADLWTLLGLILSDGGAAKAADAATASGRAILLDPGQTAALVNRGNALLRLNMPDGARQAFRAALTVDPGLPEAALGLGTALLDLGQWRAVPAVLDVIRRPSNAVNPAHLWRRVGDAARAAGDWPTALRALHQAVWLQPDDAGHRGQLAFAAVAVGRHSRGEALFHTALALAPADPGLLTNNAIALVDEGRVYAAVPWLRRALTVNPASYKAHSSLLFARQYQSGVPPAVRRAEHRLWHDRHAAALAPAAPVFPNASDPERPLRVGIVSADLKRHPVGYFLAPFLAAHDRERMTVTCYANQPEDRSAADPMTRELMRHAAGWRWVDALADEAMAALIRADAIDILIDLSGHTADHRLPVFARRPAPVQVTWLGYPHTTGMAAMDAIIGGGLEIPETAADWFEERLLALPHGRFCYRPPDEAPPVKPPPSLQAGGRVTFGSFNTLAKLSPETVALWARVLAAVPGSRLILKARPLGDLLVRDRVRDRFASAGTDPARLDLRGWSSHAAMLAEYADIDVALDPRPFSGGLTSCEALWMGVPMVAWPNDLPAGRQSAHFLDLLGLPELIVDNADAYVDTIAQLSRDPVRLETLRAGMRERMRRSPLLDGLRFARALEKALREQWRRWCRQAPGICVDDAMAGR